MVTVLALALAALGAPSTAAARSATITWYFGLQRPEARAQAAFDAVGTPGSPTYRTFPSLRQVRSRYGADPRTVTRLRRVARRHGLRARVDASGVFARLSGPATRFARIFRVRIKKQFDNDVFATTWYLVGSRQRPRIPRDMRSLVREVVPTYARSTKAPRPRTGRGAGASRAATPPPANAGTWTGGCSDAQKTGSYSFAQVRNAYGIDAVGPGTSASVAILNVGEGVAKADITANARCFGYGAVRARTLLTDGQKKPFGRGSFEPQEDLALVRGMAPGLGSLAFAQAWLTTDLWFLGVADTLDAPRLPDSLSISYGECERQVRGTRAQPSLRANALLFDALLVRLGLAGVSVFASAGDFGSTCNGSPFSGVAWPASSPYLTAVGGTRLVLDPANTRVDEVVWNDLEWLNANNGGGAGGGGLSQFSKRGSSQRQLNVPGTARAVPDVAAHASLLPGWPVVIGSDWIADAGTSSSAPLVASAFAVISARERAAGRPPLGPVNGLLYSLPSAAPNALFDVVSGNNGYLAKVPPRTAGPGYDLASGLGVLRFDRLAGALPAPAD